MIPPASIRASWRQVIGLFCFLGILTSSGLGQQVTSQVNASTSSVQASSQSLANSVRADSVTAATSAGEQSFAPAGNFGTSSAFAVTGVSGPSNSLAGNSLIAKIRGRTSGTASDSSVHLLRKGRSGGSGVRLGQFPDSTREVVLPSPLLTGESLQFFSVSVPRFTPSFNSTNHLAPSYAVALPPLTFRRKRKLYPGTSDSLLNTLKTGSNQILDSQSKGMTDPLITNGLTDPLKSQSTSLPGINQPN